MLLERFVLLHLHLVDEQLHRLVFPRVNLAFPHTLLKTLNRHCLLLLNHWGCFQSFILCLQPLQGLPHFLYLFAHSFLLLGLVLLNVGTHQRCAGVLLQDLVGCYFPLQFADQTALFLQFLRQLCDPGLAVGEGVAVLAFVPLDEVLQEPDGLAEVVHFVVCGLGVVVLRCGGRVAVAGKSLGGVLGGFGRHLLLVPAGEAVLRRALEAGFVVAGAFRSLAVKFFGRGGLAEAQRGRRGGVIIF